jgi:N12 class adenine-specific DNA methylase
MRIEDIKKALEDARELYKVSKNINNDELKNRIFINYLRFRVLNSNGADLNKLKDWASDGSKDKTMFLEALTKECRYLEKGDVLHFNNNIYEFVSSVKKTAVFENELKTLEELKQELNVSKKTDANDTIVKNKFTTNRINEAYALYDDLLEDKSNVVNYLNVASRVHNLSYSNVVLLYSQLAIRNQEEISYLKSFNTWSNTKNENDENVMIKKGSKGYDVIVPKKFKDKTTFGITKVFDISQTTANDLGLYSTVREDYEDIYYELKYSLEQSDLNVSIDIDEDMNAKDKLIELSYQIGDYYFNDSNDKEAFSYTFLSAMNIKAYPGFDYSDYDVEDIKDSLKYVTETLKNFSKKIHLDSVIYKSNIEHNLYYNIGKNDRTKLGNKSVDTAKAHEKENKLNSEVSKEAGESYKQGYYDIKKGVRNENSTTRNEELQSRELNDNNQGLPGREQKRDVPGTDRKERASIVPGEHSERDTNSNESTNRIRNEGERSLRNGKSGTNLYLDIDNITTKEIVESEQFKEWFDGSIAVNEETVNMFKEDYRQFSLRPLAIEQKNIELLITSYSNYEEEEDDLYLSQKIKDFGRVLGINNAEIIVNIGKEYGLSDEEIEPFKEHIKSLDDYEENFLIKYTDAIKDKLQELDNKEFIDLFQAQIDIFITNKYIEQAKKDVVNEFIDSIEQSNFYKAQQLLQNNLLDENTKKNLEFTYNTALDDSIDDKLENVKTKIEQNAELEQKTYSLFDFEVNISVINSDYETGLDYDEVEKYIPNLTADNDVINDGYIVRFGLELDNKDKINIFYDEKTGEYAYSLDNVDKKYQEQYADILDELGRELQKSGGNYQELYDDLNNRLTSIEVKEVSRLGIVAGDSFLLNSQNERATFLGKNIYSNDVIEDTKGVRSYQDNYSTVSESVSIIPGAGIEIDSINTKFTSGDFEYLTKDEVRNLSQDQELVNNIDVEAHKEILEDLGYLVPKFGKKADEIELNEYDSFLKENYPKMSTLDKNKYQDIIDSRIQARAETLANHFGFGLQRVNEWLEVAKFTKSRNDTNVISMAVFGIEDQFKDINEYASEIVESQEYKSWYAVQNKDNDIEGSENLLSREELESKFKEHDSRLEVFAEHNGTYSLLLKQNIVLSVVIKEATTLENLNEFYKNFNMANYDSDRGYYDESKHTVIENDKKTEFNQKTDIQKAYEDEFFGWTKTDILESLKDQELNEDIVNALIEKYDDFNRAYAEEQEERINKELEDTPFKVSIFQTSENYDEELDRDESDEYWNLAMFEAVVEYKESEEEVEDTTTGRYVEAESVVDEIESFALELKENYKNNNTEKAIDEMNKLLDLDNVEVKRDKQYYKDEIAQVKTVTDYEWVRKVIIGNKDEIGHFDTEDLIDELERTKFSGSGLSDYFVKEIIANTDDKLSPKNIKEYMEKTYISFNDMDYIIDNIKSLYNNTDELDRISLEASKEWDNAEDFRNDGDRHKIISYFIGDVLKKDEDEFKIYSYVLEDDEFNKRIENHLLKRDEIINSSDFRKYFNKYGTENIEELIANNDYEEINQRLDIYLSFRDKEKTLQQDMIDEYIGFSNDDKRETYLIENEDKINKTTLEYLHNEEPNSDLANLMQSFMNENEVPKKEEDNFTIESDLTEGGAKTKFRNNLQAIEVIRKIEKDEDITKEDRIKLSKYVGWGGIPQAFYKNDGSVAKGWENEAEELKATMTDKEYQEARRSTLDSFYTDETIAKAMWQGIENMGFKGGSILEPSVGVGNFFGYMPKYLKPNTQLLGIELDSTTSKIAQNLYPKAKIYNLGFQDFKLLPGQEASLVIGNPPYGGHKIMDKNNKDLNGMSIHNYFMCKSIDSLEPGGVMAMVVSNSFLDSQDTNTRAYIGEKANLLGAVRLPNNAFSKGANTEVTTDILFFHKKPSKYYHSNIQEWLSVGELNDTPINKYFEKNQDKLLGKWGKYGTMYRGDSPALIIEEGQDTKALLNKAIESLPIYYDSYNSKYISYEAPGVEKILANKSTHNELSNIIQKSSGDTLSYQARVNSYFINNDKIFKRLPDVNGEVVAEEISTKTNSKGEEVELKDKEIDRIKGMIKLSEVANRLKYAQLNDTLEDNEVESFRKDLNTEYDSFVKEFGYLNNATNKRLFEEDVNSSFLLALETKYDKGISNAVAKRTGETPRKESASKSDIFVKRTQRPYKAPTTAKSYEDALLISLGEKAYVDMKYMSELLNKDIETIEKYLSDKGLIYDDPNYGWVTAEEYLSGNVKQKLKETTNPKNIKALEEVIPEDIEAVDISVQAGATWIPEKDMNDFITHITEDKTAQSTYVSYNAQWKIKADASSTSREQYSTSRRTVEDILEATLNNKQLVVYDKSIDDDGKEIKVVNQEATLAVNDKSEQIKNEWNRWIWDSDDRRDRLAKLYNEKFNVYAKRKYDGTHLTLPGKVSDDVINLRPHQKNGAWRVLQGGTTLFDHTVGTGKTFTAITSAMELKRTGKANKPLVVVPNHLVQQWGKEWIELYPNANILVPTKKDFEAKRRKVLMSRIATGEYDAVIIAHSQLAKIQNDLDFEVKFIEKQIKDIQEGIDQVRKLEDKDTLSIKQWEKQQENLEAKIEELNSIDRDDNLSFSELGIDALIVDEAHEFKNLQFHTTLNRVAGLGNPKGSKKAFDLYIKVQNLLERTNGNNVVFLTGTPISNTIAEMFTMQRFLQSEQLENDGLSHFDAWNKQYAEVVADWELSPSGQYKQVTRLAKFKNMPELIANYSTFADVITREDINKMLAKEGKKLPVPKIKGGKPNNVVVPRSEDQANFIGVADEDGKISLENLKAVLRGILYQQLTRQLCPKCKIKLEEGYRANIENPCGKDGCEDGYLIIETPIPEIAEFPVFRDFDFKKTETYENYISLEQGAKEKYDLGIIDKLHYEAVTTGKRKPNLYTVDSYYHNHFNVNLKALQEGLVNESA